MKTFDFFILLFVSLWVCNRGFGKQESKTQADQNSLTPAHILKDFQIVWEDNFDGTTLNASKWKYRNEGKVNKYGTVSKNTISLDGKGCMHFKITKDSEGKLHTGELGTQRIFETTYGYFECRAAMHKQLGPSVAFRLQSADYGKTLAPVKDGTLISIFQYHRQTPKTVYQAVQWNGYGTDRKQNTKKVRVDGIDTGFHTFGLEWTKEEYIFYVDGKETWRTSEAVSQRDEYLVLTGLAGWGGDPGLGDFPDEVSFDYVRVYKPK